jgi:acetyl esterase/lipase
MSGALPYVVRSYGEHASQFVRVWTPSPSIPKSRSRRTVFLVHGGFWKSKYGLDTAAGTACETLAPDLVLRGFAPVEIEYRRGDDGCFPAANSDIVAAILFINSPAERTAIVGMSAGGQLALWAALELEPGHRPAVIAAISPVADLELAVQLRLSDSGDAVQRYMGLVPDAGAFRAACPMCRASEFEPFSSAILLVAGKCDVDVPSTMVMSLHQAIPGSLYQEFSDADHYALMRASSSAWRHVARVINERI